MKTKRSVNLENIWTKCVNQDPEIVKKTSPSYWATALLSAHLNIGRDNNKTMPPLFGCLAEHMSTGYPTEDRSAFNPMATFNTSSLAGAIVRSMTNRGSVGYICFPKEFPVIQIDSLSNYDIDNNKLEKISSMIIKEQIDFYKPYIKDIEILKVFESRLILIKDNKLYLLKRTGEKNESNICKMY